jgi:DNA-binding transcriptional MerR regulator
VRDGSWSIAEVARMSDVTSRTLRHYDAIGLLPPAWIGADGRRYYRRPELLRLQRILLLRELGLGLAAIAEALEREADPVAVLRTHRDRLAGERDRLAHLVRTVDATIESLEEVRR